MIEPYVPNGRNYLYCNVCIGWAKAERLKRFEAGTLHRTIQQSDPVLPLSLPPELLSDDAFPQADQQQYSPISEPDADAPEPTHMLPRSNAIGERLAHHTFDPPIYPGTCTIMWT